MSDVSSALTAPPAPAAPALPPPTEIDIELTKAGVSLFFNVSITNQGRNHFNLGMWNKVEGLDVQWDVVDYRAGDAGNYRWIAIGLPKYQPVKLTRYITPKRHTQLRAWLESNSFKSMQDSASIKLFAAQASSAKDIKAYEGKVNGGGGPRTVVAEWVLEGVVPARYAVASFDASSTKVVTETLELAHVGWLQSDNRI
jgi:phage tail-like protein